MKSSNFIAVGDVHLRMTPTKRRTDDMFQSQLNKLTWIGTRAGQLKSQFVLLLGDLGDAWDWKISMVNKVADVFRAYPCPVYTIIGNHDVPGRNPSLWKDTGLGILDSMGVVQVIAQNATNPCLYYSGLSAIETSDFVVCAFHSDAADTKQFLNGEINIDKSPKVLVAAVHAAVGAETTPFCIGCQELDIEGFNVALFGDIHTGWKHYRSKTGCIMGNPGSLTRLSKIDIGRKPKILVVHSNNTVHEEIVPHLAIGNCFDLVTISKEKEEIGKGFLVALAAKTIVGDVDPKTYIETVGLAAGYTKESIELLKNELL